MAHSSSEDSDEDHDDFLHPSTDPNADEFADYNPRKRRRTGRDAKESAALGIFGSESEDEGPGKRWKSKTMRSKGVSFVQSEGPTASPLGRGFVPSSAAVPVLQNDEDDNPATPKAALPSAFSVPKGGKHGAPQKGTPVNAGSFAARMMAKMGYKEGQGLGKEGQGRSGVIEVQLRPQGVGLGAVSEKSKQEREEEKRQAAIRGEVLEDSEEERKLRRKKKTSGTDSGASTPKRPPKTKYQSLQEVQRAAPGLKIPEAFTPILDLTGPGQKLLTTTSGLLTPTTGNEPTELVEARKLSRRAQTDLSAFVEEWKNLEERKAWIEMEIIQQQQAIDEQKRAADQITSAADIVQGLSETVRDLQWDPVIKALSDVKDIGFAGEEELASIAVAAVFPFFRQGIEGWQPLEDPKLSGVASDGFANALGSIHELLGVRTKDLAMSDLSITNGSYHGRSHKTSPYETMMLTLWLPKVRSAVTNTWDVHDPTPLQTLLEAWEGLLPSFIRSQIYDQLVVRKLDEAVAAWNPKKKRGNPLPHLWLFPWLQYLPAHHADPKSSTGLVTDVKRKFRHLIDAWDFRRGVIPGLQQWRSVLRPGSQTDQWTPLIMNHVVPNLAKFLRQNFQVAPQDQDPYMPYLYNTLDWEDIIGSRIMGQLLADEMFPMWHDVLHQWLTLDSVSYTEIGDWFAFWRSVLPDSLNALPVIQAEFRRGDSLINMALDDPTSKSLPLPSKPSKGSPEQPLPSPSKPPPKAEEASFRENIEDWCLANELQFIPEKTILDAQGPVFRITASPIGKGGVLVSLKNDDISALIKGVWTPLRRKDRMDVLRAAAEQ